MDLFRKLSAPVKLSIALLLIGALFKLMHWPFALEITLVACFSISITYFIQFWKNSNKQTSDSFILLSVIFFCIYWALNALHWPYILPALILCAASFLIAKMIQIQKG